MAKKDFSQLNTGRVYSTIAEATAEPAAQEILEVPQAQEEQQAQPARKPRKTYTEEEKAEFLRTLNTNGKKGVKLPRINLAFSPQVYDFIKTMSRVRGENLTEFVNMVLQEYMEEHRDVYEKALEFKNSL